MTDQKLLDCFRPIPDPYADATVVAISWQNEAVFFPGMMAMFIDHIPDEAVQLDVWDWFKENGEEPHIDYLKRVEDHLVLFRFLNEDIALLFKLTYGGA